MNYRILYRYWSIQLQIQKNTQTIVFYNTGEILPLVNSVYVAVIKYNPKLWKIGQGCFSILSISVLLFFFIKRFLGEKKTFYLKKDKKIQFTVL